MNLPDIHPKTSLAVLSIWGFAGIINLLAPSVGEAVEEASCNPVPGPPFEGMIGSGFIRYSQSITCTIGPAADVDNLKFFGNAGDKVRLQVTKTAGSGYVCGEIFDPDGVVIGSKQCSSNSSSSFTVDLDLVQTGIYSILVNEYYNYYSINYSTSAVCLFGPCNVNLLPGSPDMNGDGTDDLVIRRGNTYYIDSNNNGGSAEQAYSYGTSDDVVFTADLDGDGADELVIRRGNRFLIDSAGNGGLPEKTITYGKPEDLIFPSDVNGDGQDELVIRRDNRFFVDGGHNGGLPEQTFSYGTASDALLQGFGSQ